MFFKLIMYNLSGDNMKKINLVTGASGHLGFTIVKTLKENNEFVRVLLRSDAALEYLERYVDEVFYGDVTNADDVLKACDNVSIVYHSAALITLGREMKVEVHKINVEGTKNIIDACLKNNVKRLVYVSSAHAIDFKNKKEIIREKQYLEAKKVKGNYAKSKAEASNMVIDANSKELETICIMPTAIIGPNAFKDSPFNGFLSMHKRKKMKVYLKGCYNFIDVRDTAEVIYSASTVGNPGNSYIISGTVMTVKEILDFLETKTDIKSPKIKIPLPILRIAAPVIEMGANLMKKRALFNSHTVYTLNSNPNFDNSKAINELGLNVRDVRDSLYEQYIFLNEINKKTE